MIVPDRIDFKPLSASTAPLRAPGANSAAFADRGLPWLVGVASVIFFFRHALLDGLAHTYGEAYDGLIEIAILEHWKQVWTAGADWSLTGWFHPVPGTLGYNDTYVLPGVPYTMARVAGADPFIAAFVSDVTMKVVGFVGMFWMLRRALGIGQTTTLVGAALFTIAGATLLQIGHAQLLSLGLVPWLAGLSLLATNALRSGDRRRLLRFGVLFAVVFGLTAVNAFYMAWFFSCLAACVAILRWLMLPPSGRTLAVASGWDARLTLMLFATVLALALTPLVAVYGARVAAGSSHSWVSMVGLLPRPLTLLNVGEHNLLWGTAWRWLHHATEPSTDMSGEQLVGFGPVMLGCLVAATWWAWRHRDTGAARACLGVIAACAVIVVTTLRFSGDFTLWRFVYDAVPGGGVVRAVARFYLVLLVPVIAVVAVWLDRTQAVGRRATPALLGLLLIEQVQTRAQLEIEGAVEGRLLALPPPPASCAAFFVVDARVSPPPLIGAGNHRQRLDLAGLYRHNVDAMLLAAYWNRPTINGISSFNPAGWDLADPRAPNYLARVRATAMRHDVRPLCGLDIRRSHPWFRLS